MGERTHERERNRDKQRNRFNLQTDLKIVLLEVYLILDFEIEFVFVCFFRLVSVNAD